MNISLLKQLCSIHSPSGDEENITKFLLNYIKKEKKNWKHQPKIYAGKGFQNAIVLVFGKPKTAIFAHIDSIGFTVRYDKQLVKIGGPRTKSGYELVGEDSVGEIQCKLKVSKKRELSYVYKRKIDTGTSLTFKPNFKNTKNYVQCCYIDNRLGVYNALQIAETLKDGIICFSCWEEHGGGSAEVLGKFVYEKYNVEQALISDITWITEGVTHGKGVVISMRDSGIPRQSYVRKIIETAKKHKIPYQLEVEGAGGSDGNSLQKSAYAFDWCFVGAPENNVHTPNEKVHKKDIEAMVELYKILMREL